MPELKIIKRLLATTIIVVLLSLGLTGYSIVRNEVSNRDFVERTTLETSQRETQLATKLDNNIQRQILGLRENFIAYQIDQVTQTRKLVALEVATQLKQAKEVK